jgi:hypothetical protein
MPAAMRGGYGGGTVATMAQSGAATADDAHSLQ